MQMGNFLFKYKPVDKNIKNPLNNAILHPRDHTMNDALAATGMSETSPAEARRWQEFLARIRALLPAEHIISDLARRIALSTDASFYTKTPKLVVRIPSPDAMQAFMALAFEYRIAVTFRAAGTSLSGQAISDSVLVMLTRDWTDSEISEDGHAITLQPGIIGAAANRLLAPYHRKIGPDPASIATCKVGGIAANNASGMCCGVKDNSYHTLNAMHVIFADGSDVDTACEQSVARFRETHATLLTSIRELSNDIRANPALCDKIRYLYRLKNTMGYGINALLDYDDPLDVLIHLMIGSEGTLGFIASITYRTIALPQARQSGLFLFPSARIACESIPALAAQDVDAVELMDTRALRSVADLLAPFYAGPIAEGAVALLIDVGADDDDTLTDTINAIRAALPHGSGAATVIPMCDFTADPVTINALWQIRKGLFPAVGAVRETGTTVIIEDVAFPLTELADGLDALSLLFDKHGYDEAIIFGHALDGNVHFVFTQRFDTPDETRRYNAFMQDVGTLVTLQFNGTLKAEHGTGRNMAPFLHSQWGTDGVAIMRRIKSLIDPAGILNPGVILNDDPNAHLTDLKSLPAVSDDVDKCIECGFCEPECPSLHYTLSPRQRIALQRRQHDLPVAERGEVNVAFEHLGMDSCAATGMCATACPVGINTGEWIKSLRRQQASHHGTATLMANQFATASAIARFTLSATHAVAAVTGSRTLQSLSTRLRKHSGGKTPLWYPAVPKGASASLPAGTPANAKVVYVPACPNRIFGPQKGQRALPEVVTSLLNKAGFEVIYPTALSSLCCGQPWDSKGYRKQAQSMQAQWEQHIMDASDKGRWPVITDASPCSRQLDGSGAVKTQDVTGFLLNQVVPRLTITPLATPVMLHVTCSSSTRDQGHALRQLTHLCASQVIEPEDIPCCGFAGDKGLFEPELNAAALATLKSQIPASCTWAVTDSKTCEIGLSHYSGLNYQHIACLLDEVSEPRRPSATTREEPDQ